MPIEEAMRTVAVGGVIRVIVRVQFHQPDQRVVAAYGSQVPFSPPLVIRLSPTLVQVRTGGREGRHVSYCWRLHGVDDRLPAVLVRARDGGAGRVVADVFVAVFNAAGMLFFTGTLFETAGLDNCPTMQQADINVMWQARAITA